MTLGKAEGLVATEASPARYASRDQLIGRFSMMLPHIPLQEDAFAHRGTDRFARQVDEVALLTQGLLTLRSLNDAPDYEVVRAVDHSMAWLLTAVRPITGRIKAQYMTGATGRADTDDFEQSVRLHLITKALPEFDVHRASFTAFYGSVAKRCVIDRVRMERTATRYNGFSVEQFFGDQDSDAGSTEFLGSDPNDIHSIAVFHERIRLLANMLSRSRLMSNEQRQAYIAVVLNGSTEVEYAERINAPIGTVKTWVRTARQKIIRKMELLGHTDYAADTP